jgi:hypothetical protein
MIIGEVDHCFRKKPALLLLASQMNVDNNDSASSVNSDDFAKELQDVVAAAQHDNSDEEEENEQKSKRKYPRSKAQVLVDEAEDLEGEGEHVHNLDLSNLKAWKISSRVWNLLHIETLNLSVSKVYQFIIEHGDPLIENMNRGTN